MEGGSSPPSQVPSHLGEGFSKVLAPNLNSLHEMSSAAHQASQP